MSERRPWLELVSKREAFLNVASEDNCHPWVFDRLMVSVACVALLTAVDAQWRDQRVPQDQASFASVVA